MQFACGSCIIFEYVYHVTEHPPSKHQHAEREIPFNLQTSTRSSSLPAARMSKLSFGEALAARLLLNNQYPRSARYLTATMPRERSGLPYSLGLQSRHAPRTNQIPALPSSFVSHSRFIAAIEPSLCSGCSSIGSAAQLGLLVTTVDGRMNGM